MSYKGNLLKGIFQEIQDQQALLDKRIIKDHDLFDDEDNVNLMANFDENRIDSLLTGYLYLRTAVKAMRQVGAKWWKKQEPMTDEQYAKFTADLLGGEFLETDILLSNVSMKIIAIVQELVELEDAILEGKPKEDIHDEFIDVIHFVVSLGLDIGINSEEQIKILYDKKNRTNHQRQDESY
jgi:NTP pyrophosphatase (non-canonical NTP hydrolase)